MEINKNLLWLETGEKGEKGMALTVRFTGRIGGPCNGNKRL